MNPHQYETNRSKVQSNLMRPFCDMYGMPKQWQSEAYSMIERQWTDNFGMYTAKGLEALFKSYIATDEYGRFPSIGKLNKIAGEIRPEREQTASQRVISNSEYEKEQIRKAQLEDDAAQRVRELKFWEFVNKKREERLEGFLKLSDDDVKDIALDMVAKCSESSYSSPNAYFKCYVHTCIRNVMRLGLEKDLINAIRVGERVDISNHCRGGIKGSAFMNMGGMLNGR